MLVAFIDFDEIFQTINAPKCMCLMAHLVTSLYFANCTPLLYNYFRILIAFSYCLQLSTNGIHNVSAHFSINCSVSGVIVSTRFLLLIHTWTG